MCNGPDFVLGFVTTFKRHICLWKVKVNSYPNQGMTVKAHEQLLSNGAVRSLASSAHNNTGYIKTFVTLRYFEPHLPSAHPISHRFKSLNPLATPQSLTSCMDDPLRVACGMSSCHPWILVDWTRCSTRCTACLCSALLYFWRLDPSLSMSMLVSPEIYCLLLKRASVAASLLLFCGSKITSHTNSWALLRH